MAKQELEKRKKTEVQTQEAIPEWVKAGNDGFENVDADDYAPPRLGICQDLSPELKKHEPRYIEDAEPGSFFNTTTRELYDQPLRVTPFLYWRSRIRWATTSIGGGIECIGRPADKSLHLMDNVACQLSAGQSCLHPDLNEERPCNLFKNFLCVLHHDMSLILISMKGAMLTQARNWTTMMQMRKLPNGQQVPMWAQQFDFMTIPDKRPKGTFWNFKFVVVPGFAPRNVAGVAATQYEAMNKRTAHIIIEDERTPGAGAEEDM